MIILGDNPFFGVNHASAIRAQSYYERLQSKDWSAVHTTMRAALQEGINHFMVTTHAEAPMLLQSMADDELLRKFSIIPAVPYLHRLNGLVASRGIASAFFNSLSYSRFACSLIRGNSLKSSSLYAFIAREVSAVMEFGFEVPAIALQNVFVDLMLGLGQEETLNEVAAQFRAENRRLVAITMNPLLADKRLDKDIVLCTHYNYLGYMVQPTLTDAQTWIESTKRQVWAMGVLASGRAQLNAVCSDRYLRKFDSVVLGASRPASVQSFVSGYAHAR